MSPKWMAAAVSALLGCSSTAELKMTLSASESARVPADVQSVATARKSVAEASAALAKAEGEASRQPTPARIAANPASGGATELAAVVEAQRQRTLAYRKWRAANVELMRCRLERAQAQLELEKALFLDRSGADFDSAPFRGQEARLHARESAAVHELAARHAELDTRERTLAATKESYAVRLRPASRVALRSEAVR